MNVIRFRLHSLNMCMCVCFLGCKGEQPRGGALQVAETDAGLGSRGQSDVGVEKEKELEERERRSRARGGGVDVAISANSIWISATRKRGMTEAPS